MMDSDDLPSTDGYRGRIVMLVDNAVNGDSRVQKIARSAADAGWHVTLLGRSPDRHSHEWMLGAAQVRLLPLASLLGTRRHQFRRAWLRGPLGYPPNGVGEVRTQQMKGWQADLAARRAELKLEMLAGTASFLDRKRLGAETRLSNTAQRWVQFRRKQASRAEKARKRLDGPWDRFYTWFWAKVMGDRAWRRLEPALWDWELAFGKTIDKLKPDLIHAHDFRMIGVGARAALRARGAGRDVKLIWDAHEFLPGIRPRRDDERWMPAHVAHEREYARYADAVITVSSGLADLLQETHRLPEIPSVILNAPSKLDSRTQTGVSLPNVRDLCAVDPATPLLVYSGAAAPQRGLATIVEALPQLPTAHAAFIVNAPDGSYLRGLVKRAAELGVQDRLHVLPYVEHWQVVSFLSAADVGIIPIHHWPNHEIALITKFFEYSHARLPIVVSDMRTMSEMVRHTGQGEIFKAEDVQDLVRAVAAVLADPQRYRAAYETPGLLDSWTWEAQAEILDGLYTKLLPGRPPRRNPEEVSVAQRELVASERTGGALE